MLLPGLKFFISLMESRNNCCRIISPCGGQTQIGEHVVYIFSVSAIVVSSGYVEKCYFVFFYQASQFGSTET